MPRYSPLNERQLKVLRWIAEGCPQRDWPDHTHKSSALALQGRGLVKVSKKGGTWSATITQNGRFYLDHGRYPEHVERRPSKTTSTAPITSDSTSATSLTESEITDLIEQVRTSGGVLRVENPDLELGSAYRRALNRLRGSPAGIPVAAHRP